MYAVCIHVSARFKKLQCVYIHVVSLQRAIHIYHIHALDGIDRQHKYFASQGSHPSSSDEEESENRAWKHGELWDSYERGMNTFTKQHERKWDSTTELTLLFMKKLISHLLGEDDLEHDDDVVGDDDDDTDDERVQTEEEHTCVGAGEQK